METSVLAEVVYVSLSANTPRKGMNPSLLHSAMSYVKQICTFSLGTATGLGDENF